MTSGLLKPRNIEPILVMSPLLAPRTHREFSVTRDLVSPRQLVTLLQQTDNGTGALSNDLSRFRTGVFWDLRGNFGIHGWVIYASIIAAAFIFDSWLITGTHFDPVMRFHSMLAFRRFFPWKSCRELFDRTQLMDFTLGNPNKKNRHRWFSSGNPQTHGWALFWATVDGSEIPNNHHLGFGAKTCRK